MLFIVYMLLITLFLTIMFMTYLMDRIRQRIYSLGPHPYI